MGEGGPRIGVLGAGSIGTFVGGHLAAAGYDTVLVGRQALVDEVAARGLTLTQMGGPATRLGPEDVPLGTEVSALGDRDVVLVAVKSLGTGRAADELASALAPGTVVVSLQNGIRNADTLRERLPGCVVLAGMVAFNVVWKPGATFHRGTTGGVVVERGEGADRVVAALRAAGFDAHARSDVERVLWGKLVLNLNNALNAIVNLPLREELSDRGYRRILAALISEALAVLRGAGIRPARTGRVLPRLVPHVLRLPDALFSRIARPMIEIDPEARSSTWEDLERGRPTEVDFLNGEVVALARRHGLEAPLNGAVVELVHELEQEPGDRGRWTPETLALRLGCPSAVS